MKHNILILLLLFAAKIHGQSIDFVQYYTHRLAADSLAGRGYVANGQQRAAAIIASCFDSLGLKKTGLLGFDGFFQNFNIHINTITEATIPKQELGIHWLPNPSCVSIKARLKKAKLGQKPPPRTFWVVDSSLNVQEKQLTIQYAAQINQPLINATHSKLTHSLSGEQSNNVNIDWLKTRKVPKKIVVNIQSAIKKHQVANVAAKIDGQILDSFLIITAHYDHLGAIGKTVFNGANDNASGTATILDLARHFSTKKNHYTLIFIAFAAEEAGLLGSYHFLSKLNADTQKRIKGVLNLDLLGGGSAGVMLVNGQALPHWVNAFNDANKQAKLSQIGVRPNAPNSDHYPFTQANIPAIFLYTMGDVTAYHDPKDKAEHLHFNSYSQIFTLLTQFIENFHANVR